MLNWYVRTNIIEWNTWYILWDAERNPHRVILLANKLQRTECIDKESQNMICTKEYYTKNTLYYIK